MIGNGASAGEVFRFGWRGSHYPGRPVEDLWIAIGRDTGGAWWFDAYFIGRVRLRGGPQHVAGFARWLLTVPPENPYESEFMLIDDEPQPGQGISLLPEGTLLTVEVRLGREETGGPEFLQVLPSGLTAVLPSGQGQRAAFQVCAELECQPVDRIVLEQAAATLLAITAGEIQTAPR
jgi:hypothetical protein